jgi:hypothetical protein
MKNKKKVGVYSREYKNSKAYLRGVIPNIARGKSGKER